MVKRERYNKSSTSVSGSDFLTYLVLATLLVVLALAASVVSYNRQSDMEMQNALNSAYVAGFQSAEVNDVLYSQ